MPPTQAGSSAIGQIAAALQALESHPLPASIAGVAADMFDAIAPELGGFNRVALSNRWLFGPILQGQLERSASTNALLRTTTALTIVNAGNKDNVLPGRAEAVVNFRLLPGESGEAVEAHVRKVIRNDGITVSRLGFGSEPSRLGSSAGSGYQEISRTVRELFPDTIVAPGLMLGATDARHFESLADQVYRFSPVRAKPEDLARFHGTNERISASNFVELIRFYHRLLQQAVAR